MTEFLNAYGMQIASVLLYALLGGIGIALKNIAGKYLTDERLKAVAKTAMMAVEQLYKDLHGREKMEAALKIAAEMLADKGINANAYELRMLIEAAVGEFNAQFHPEKYEKTAAYEGPQQGGSMCDPSGNT